MNNISTAPSKLEQEAFFHDVTKASRKGKVIHKLMELKIRRLTNQLENEKDRQKATAEFNEIKHDVTSEYQAIAQDAASIIVADFTSMKALEPDTIIQTEAWVHLHEFIRGGKGRVDAVIITPTTIHIMDLKTGSHPVEPDKSAQMKAYTADLAIKHPNHCIVVSILQAGQIKTKKIDTAAAIEWATEMGRRIRDAKARQASDPVAQQLMYTLNEIEEMDTEDISHDVLMALYEACSVKAKIF